MIRRAGKMLVSLLLYLLTGGRQNNENTKQYTNKTVCVGCTERTSVVFSIILLFYLCCLVPLSVHYRLCLITVCVKVLQNGRLVRFSRRTDCWCAFRWSICNQIGHFIKCIQRSNFQGYDRMQKSWKDVIS